MISRVMNKKTGVPWVDTVCKPLIYITTYVYIYEKIWWFLSFEWTGPLNANFSKIYASVVSYEPEFHHGTLHSQSYWGVRLDTSSVSIKCDFVIVVISFVAHLHSLVGNLALISTAAREEYIRLSVRAFVHPPGESPAALSRQVPPGTPASTSHI